MGTKTESRMPLTSSLLSCPVTACANKPGQLLVPMFAAAAAALSLGGCAQPAPQKLAYANSAEYFPSSIFGRASPRVVADGEPVPRGGGFYMVGKPYTIAGHTYYPSEKRYAATGFASWYGDAFHGRRTANGEVYDRDAVSAAHPTLPLPSYARVTNLRNRYSLIVRVNDRGPFLGNRILDVSRKVAQTLGFHRKGTTPVRVEYIGAASLAGSDDQKLLTTLRTNGPAVLADAEIGRDQSNLGQGATTAVARAETGPDVRPGTVTTSEPAPPALFKGKPVPLPPARPVGLGMDTDGRTKLALRRTSF